jgi:hypothetical protein
MGDGGGDYKPLVAFLFATLILNVFLYSTYDAFGQVEEFNLTVQSENSTGIVGVYFDFKDFVDDIKSYLFLVPNVIIDFLTLGLYTDTVATLVLIWASLPTALFTILFIPMLTGAVYSIAKLIPFV